MPLRNVTVPSAYSASPFAAAARAIECALEAEHPLGQELDVALRLLAEGCGVARGFFGVFVVEQDCTRFTLTHEWTADASDAQKAKINARRITVDRPILRRWVNQLATGQALNVSADEVEDAAEAAMLRAQGSQQMVMAPVFAGSKLRGFLGIDSRRLPSKLGAADENAVYIFAQVLGLAIARHEVDAQFSSLEERFQWSGKHSREAFCVHDASGRYLYISPAFTSLTGYVISDTLGSRPQQWIHPDDYPAVRAAMVSLALGEQSQARLRYRFQSLADQWIWLESHVEALQSDPRGSFLSWTRDVTEPVAAQAALVRERRSAEVILASIAEGVITTDADGNVDYLNHTAELLTGFDLVSAQGLPIEVVFPALPRPQLAQDLHSCFLRWLRLGRRTWTLTRLDGAEYRVEFTLAPLLSDTRETVGLVLSFRDVGATENLAAQLRHLSTHDPLTGLLDRDHFSESCDRLVGQQARSDQLFMVFVGLDQLHLINDGFGYAAGDELIRHVARCLQAHLDESELVARLGGDEFAWLVVATSLDSAMARVEGLLARVRERSLSWDGRVLRTAASAGVARLAADSRAIVDAMASADTALTIAKEQGRGRAHVFREEDLELSARRLDMDWILRLQTALETDEFVLQAQPIVRSDWVDEPFRRAEVLIALPDARGGLISPGRFLPTAARAGLIGAIDRFVVRRSIELLRERELRGLPRFESLAVNISGYSLGEEDFLADILALLRELNDPTQLTIEITESEAISNLARAQSFIEAVRRRGTRFALDDFGSGLSSFAYLKALPVDYLKIDGQFVRDVETDPVDMAFVEAIQKIATTMGLKTVAEFVESATIQKCMASIGVDYCQGYAISRPVPIGQILLK